MEEFAYIRKKITDQIRDTASGATDRNSLKNDIIIQKLERLKFVRELLNLIEIELRELEVR